MPHTVVVELNLWYAFFVMLTAQSHVVGFSLGDVVFEVLGMEAAGGSADATANTDSAIAQPHLGSAFVCLVVVLRVIVLSGEPNLGKISDLDLHPPDVLGVEFPGVLEVGSAILYIALRFPSHHLACLVVAPFSCGGRRHLTSNATTTLHFAQSEYRTATMCKERDR